jgi:5-methylcytosine-specific restriction protein B
LKLMIPDNLYIIGTVNMDETTHPFSKKVLDRAATIEFNEIILDGWMKESVANQNQELDAGEHESHLLEVPNSFLRSDYLRLIDLQQSPDFNEPLMRWVTSHLVELNRLLQTAHLHIGYRLRDTICFYLTYNDRFKLLNDEYEALDLQVLQRILPRIQGSGRTIERLIKQLLEWALDGQVPATSKLKQIDGCDYTFYVEESNRAGRQKKFPRSLNKLLEMLRRLEEDDYTSYWIV